MIIGKPTTEQLEAAREVIEYLIEHTKATEPYATEFIAAGEVFSNEMPISPDDL